MDQLEVTLTSIINIIGVGIDALGVGVIVVGIAAATAWYLKPGETRESYYSHRFRDYRIRLGQSLLLGLEILVAGDIVRTVALGLNFASLGALGLLVIIRTFLSWTLDLEVEGRWPWQPERVSQTNAADSFEEDADGREILPKRRE